MPPDTCWSLIREKKERKPSGKRDIKDFQALAVGERLPHTWNTNYVSQRNATLIFVASLTYTSLVLAPFSRSRRGEEIACTTNTRVALYLFASFFPFSFSPFFPPFFLSFFFLFLNKEKKNATNEYLYSLDQTQIPGIFNSQTNQNREERNNRMILARMSETRLVVRFVVQQGDEKCTTVRWHFSNFSSRSLGSQNLCNLALWWATLRESSRFSICWLGNLIKSFHSQFLKPRIIIIIMSLQVYLGESKRAET